MLTTLCHRDYFVSRFTPILLYDENHHYAPTFINKLLNKLVTYSSILVDNYVKDIK